MSVVNETRGFSSRKLHDGMIKSRGRKAGDLVIAGICLVMMIVCLLPMLDMALAVYGGTTFDQVGMEAYTPQGGKP